MSLWTTAARQLARARASPWYPWLQRWGSPEHIVHTHVQCAIISALQTLNSFQSPAALLGLFKLIVGAGCKRGSTLQTSMWQSSFLSCSLSWWFQHQACLFFDERDQGQHRSFRKNLTRYLPIGKHEILQTLPHYNTNNVAVMKFTSTAPNEVAVMKFTSTATKHCLFRKFQTFMALMHSLCHQGCNKACVKHCPYIRRQSKYDVIYKSILKNSPNPERLGTEQTSSSLIRGSSL